VATFNYDFEVCGCKKVTLGEIIHAIKEKNAKSIDDIESITDAGSACKCCKSKDADFGEPKLELYLDQIVTKLVK